jgi:tRNA (adenine57-N1/adenine58-N1)-methyltransferase catalytic subunit
VGPLVEGESALLLDQQGNRYLVNLRPGGRFVSHAGSVRHDELIGLEEGTEVRTSNHVRLLVFRPRLFDYVLEMPRNSAIIYPKDLAVLLMWADVFPGATVLEAGLGSGSLTLALLRAVGDRGRVICYEQRADFVERGLQNIRRFQPEPPNLLIREHDIYSGIPDTDLDRLLLDLPEPWRVVPHALTALRPGGMFAAYTPSIVQAQQTYQALQESRRFTQLETLETFYRPWHIQGAAVRPVQQMVAHTAFLTFGRLGAFGPPTRATPEIENS